MPRNTFLFAPKTAKSDIIYGSGPEGRNAAHGLPWPARWGQVYRET
jgi:hypothetical protein